MKLVEVPNAPEWLKRDTESGYYYVRIFRKSHGRLEKSTKEKASKERAKAIGEKIVTTWLANGNGTQKARITFAEVAKELVDQYEGKFQAGEVRFSTIDKIRRYIGRYLIDEFGSMYLDTFTVRDWNRFVATVRRHNSKKNLEAHWKHMGYVMNYAKSSGLLLAGAWEKVENPSPGKKIGRVITPAEKEALFQAALPVLRDQMLFASTMGMRLREHLKLSWDISYCCHVDMTLKRVTVCPKHSKTHKGRTIAMSPQVYEMLTLRAKFEYWHEGFLKRKLAQSDWVFPSETDRSKPTNSNKKAWASAKRNAKIKGRLRYHDWRHTWLTEAAKKVRNGHTSIALVCAYAGLSIQTFQKNYLHLNENDTMEIAELITADAYQSPKTKLLSKYENIEAPKTIGGKLGESSLGMRELH